MSHSKTTGTFEANLDDTDDFQCSKGPNFRIRKAAEVPKRRKLGRRVKPGGAGKNDLGSSKQVPSWPKARLGQVEVADYETTSASSGPEIELERDRRLCFGTSTSNDSAASTSSISKNRKSHFDNLKCGETTQSEDITDAGTCVESDDDVSVRSGKVLVEKLTGLSPAKSYVVKGDWILESEWLKKPPDTTSESTVQSEWSEIVGTSEGTESVTSDVTVRASDLTPASREDWSECAGVSDVKQSDAEEMDVAQEKDDHELAKRLAEEEGQQPVTEDAVIVCQVCQKEISHMNSMRRLQHVNKCMDQQLKLEQQRVAEEAETERLQKAVLPCPMCDAKFRQAQSKKNHLKTCAKKKKVTAQELRVLLFKQEQDYLQKLVDGELPMPPPEKVKKKRPAQKKKEPAVIKEPTSKYEEDMQMTLALSRSLLEFSGNAIKPAVPTAAPQKTAKGKKKMPATIPLLVSRVSEERKRMTEDRVYQLVLQDGGCQVPEIVNLKPSRMVEEDWDDSVQVVQGSLEGSLWARCCTTSDEILKEFYITDLMPPISPCKVAMGSKLRRMSQVPGRRKSLASQLMVERNESEPPGEVTPQLDNMDSSHVLDEDGLLNISERIQATGFCTSKDDEQADEAETEPTSSHQDNGIILDFKRMIGNPQLSDVSILCKNVEYVPAHKFVFAARCPQLLDQVIREKIIEFVNVSRTAVLVLLTYLYTGEVVDDDLDEADVCDDVGRLGDRFSLNTLVDACKKKGWMSAPAIASSSGMATTEMEDLLNSIWEDEDDVDNGEMSETEKENDDMDEEDVREIYEFMTQRNRANSQKNRTNVTLEDQGIVDYDVYFDVPGEMRESVAEEASHQESMDVDCDVFADEGRSVDQGQNLGRAKNRTAERAVSASGRVGNTNLDSVSHGNYRNKKQPMFPRDTAERGAPDGSVISNVMSNGASSNERGAVRAVGKSGSVSESTSDVGEIEKQVVQLEKTMEEKKERLGRNGISTVQVDEFIIEDHGSETFDTDVTDIEIDEDIWSFTEVSPKKPPKESRRDASQREQGVDAGRVQRTQEFRWDPSSSGAGVQGATDSERLRHEVNRHETPVGKEIRTPVTLENNTVIILEKSERNKVMSHEKSDEVMPHKMSDRNKVMSHEISDRNKVMSHEMSDRNKVMSHEASERNTVRSHEISERNKVMSHEISQKTQASVKASIPSSSSGMERIRTSEGSCCDPERELFEKDMPENVELQKHKHGGHTYQDEVTEIESESDEEADGLGPLVVDESDEASGGEDPLGIDEKDSEKYRESDASIGGESDELFGENNELNRSIQELKRQLEEKCAKHQRNMREIESSQILKRFSKRVQSSRGSVSSFSSESSRRSSVEESRKGASVGSKQGVVANVEAAEHKGYSSGEDVHRACRTVEHLIKGPSSSRDASLKPTRTGEEMRKVASERDQQKSVAVAGEGCFSANVNDGKGDSRCGRTATEVKVTGAEGEDSLRAARTSELVARRELGERSSASGAEDVREDEKLRTVRKAATGPGYPCADQTAERLEKNGLSSVGDGSGYHSSGSTTKPGEDEFRKSATQMDQQSKAATERVAEGIGYSSADDVQGVDRMDKKGMSSSRDSHSSSSRSTALSCADESRKVDTSCQRVQQRTLTTGRAAGGQGYSSGEDVRSHRSDETAGLGATRNTKPATYRSKTQSVEVVPESIKRGFSTARDVTNPYYQSDRGEEETESNLDIKIEDEEEDVYPIEKDRLKFTGANSMRVEKDKSGSCEQRLSQQAGIGKICAPNAGLLSKEDVEVSSIKSEPEDEIGEHEAVDSDGLVTSTTGQMTPPEKRRKTFRAMCTHMPLTPPSPSCTSLKKVSHSINAETIPRIRKSDKYGQVAFAKTSSSESRLQATHDKGDNTKDRDVGFALPRSPVRSKVRTSGHGTINDERIAKKSPGFRNPGSPVVKLRKLSPRSLNLSGCSEISRRASDVMKFTPVRDMQNASWQKSSTPCTPGDPVVNDYSKEDSLFLSPVHKDQRSTFQLVTPKTESPKAKHQVVKTIQSPNAPTQKNQDLGGRDVDRSLGHIVKTQEPPIFDIDTPYQSFAEGASSVNLFDTSDTEKYTSSPRFDKVYHSPKSKLGDAKSFTHLSDDEDYERSTSLRLAPHLVVAESPTAHIQSDAAPIEIPPRSPLFLAAPKTGFYKSPRKKSTSLFTLLDSPKVRLHASPGHSPKSQEGLKRHPRSPEKLAHNLKESTNALKRKRLQSYETDANRLKRKRRDNADFDMEKYKWKEVKKEDDTDAKLTKDFGEERKRNMKDDVIVRRPCRDEITSSSGFGYVGILNKMKEKSQETNERGSMENVSERAVRDDSDDVSQERLRNSDRRIGDGDTGRDHRQHRVPGGSRDSQFSGSELRGQMQDSLLRKESRGEKDRTCRGSSLENLGMADGKRQEAQNRAGRDRRDDNINQASDRQEGVKVINVDADSPVSSLKQGSTAWAQDGREPKDYPRRSKERHQDVDLSGKGERHQDRSTRDISQSEKRTSPHRNKGMTSSLEGKRSPIVVEILDSDEEDDKKDIPLLSDQSQKEQTPLSGSNDKRRSDANSGEISRQDESMYNMTIPDAYDENVHGFRSPVSSGHHSSQGDMFHDVSMPPPYEEEMLIPSPRIGRVGLTSSQESRHGRSAHQDLISSPRTSQPRPSTSRVYSPDMFEDDDEEIVTGGPEITVLSDESDEEQTNSQRTKPAHRSFNSPRSSGAHNDTLNAFLDDSSFEEVPVVQEGRKFKTPSALSRKGSNAPSPFTPMADYEAMNTPQIKAELARIGVRPQGKKKAIKLLKHVYEETHQYETDPDYTPVAHESRKRPGKVLVTKKICHEMTFHSDDDDDSNQDKVDARLFGDIDVPVMSRIGKGQSRQPGDIDVPVKSRVGKGQSQQPGDIDVPVKSRIGKDQPQQPGGRKRILSREEAQAALATKRRPVHEISDSESDMESSSSSSGTDSDASLTDEGNLTLSQQESNRSMKQQVLNFIRRDEELYTMVLKYKPFEFNWLANKLKDAGLACPSQKLMDILDEQCIVFRAQRPARKTKKSRQRKTKKVLSATSPRKAPSPKKSASTR